MKRKRVTTAVKYEIIKLYGGVCINCGEADNLQFHHVVPLEIGGRDICRNMVPLCYKCHKAVTNHQHVLSIIGRGGRLAGGRPAKIPENYKEILDGYIHCRYGAAECSDKLGISRKNHLTDNRWFREYLQELGIIYRRNNVDMKRYKGTLKLGAKVGVIIYADGRKETCIWQD